MAKARGLIDGVPKLHEAADLAAKVKELCELAKVQGTKKADWPDESIYEAVKDAFTDFRGDLPKRFDVFMASTEGTTGAAHAGHHFLRVAVAADDEYRRRKRRAGVLDFQDLLVSARDLLRDHREVRDALRERFRFLLLDELQDTDPVQMELVELLCGAGLQHGKLFAVGDHKQSIYRFRGAEVQLFTKLRESVAKEGRLGLTRNYRSQPDVLKFVNALFGKRLEEYEPIAAHHKAVGDLANVELLWSMGDGGANDVRAAEADAIARRIVELLADPTPRVLGKDGEPPRRVECKDITLLFRSMTHVAIYESALRRHGLDYYLVGGRAFFAQQEVYDLLNLLRAVENPHDSASLVGALRSPFFNLSDETVFLLATHDDGPWAGLHDSERLAMLPDDQKPAAERAAKWLAAWRELKDRLPIARLLNRVLADTGYDAALQFEYLGDRKLANLWKLVELARTFDRTGLFGLHEFTARLGDLVARQPREEQAATLPESADVVKLMSIHQAKGSEVPVVFIPDFAAQGRGNQYPVARWHREMGCLVRLPSEFDELPEEERPFSSFAYDLGRTADQLADWQEDLRVLYVACTRARDLLILSAGLPGPLTTTDRLPANHWTLLLEERFDVRTGRCLATDVKTEEVPDVRVVMMEVGESSERTPTASGGEVAKQSPPHHPTPSLPNFLSLPALEAHARGESVPYTSTHFVTEDDSDRARWRTPRERVGPVSPADAVLWAVLERWNFADVDGWVQLLADALEDAHDRKIGDELQPKFAKFAASPVRAMLAIADDVHRNVEFLADLGELSECSNGQQLAGLSLASPLVGEVAAKPRVGGEAQRTREGYPPPGGEAPPTSPTRGEVKKARMPGAASLSLRGVIDLLYRDAAGWHILGIDRGTALEDDPWRGRRPGLVLQAWAASKQLGAWPVSIGLFDLATGQLVQTDPQRFPLSAVVEHFLRAANPKLGSEQTFSPHPRV